MRLFVIVFVVGCQLFAAQDVLFGQDGSISVGFEVKAFALQGDLTHDSENGGECEVRAVVLKGEAASEGDVRVFISGLLNMNPDSLTTQNQATNVRLSKLVGGKDSEGEEGLYLTTKKSAVNFSVKVEAGVTEDLMVILMFNRVGSTRFTAVVPYIPVKRQLVNGERKFAPHQSHSIDVTVPKYQPACPPLVSAPCPPVVSAKRVPASCLRIVRRK